LRKVLFVLAASLAVLFMAAPSQASTVGAMPKASIGVWVNNTRCGWLTSSRQVCTQTGARLINSEGDIDWRVIGMNYPAGSTVWLEAHIYSASNMALVGHYRTSRYVSYSGQSVSIGGFWDCSYAVTVVGHTWKAYSNVQPSSQVWIP